MASLNAKYANVVATQAACAETAVSLLKELAEDPRDRGFGMLLGRHLPEGGKPMVIVVSGLSR